MKREKIYFNTFHRKMNCNILCLQDTHFTKEKENEIRNQWGYQACFSSYTSNSRGVAILFNSNFEFQILNEKKDTSGYLLALNFKLENKTITLITIYGPNNDAPFFLTNKGDNPRI